MQVAQGGNRMKTSPWKFLVGLTSRRRQEQAQESSIGEDTDPKVSASDVLPSNSNEASATPDNNENGAADRTAATSNDPGGDPDVRPPLFSSGDAREARPSTRDAADHSEDEADALAQESQTRKPSRQTRQIKPLAPAKRVRVRAVAPSAVDTNEDQSAQPLSSGAPSFLGEVADLDEEINQLKNLLAQKLHLQNLQLKKMLERFNVS